MLKVIEFIGVLVTMAGLIAGVYEFFDSDNGG